MTGPITQQWTGNGLADGTVINAGNVNSAGNGTTVTRSYSGTATWTTVGDGFNVTTATAADIARLDASSGITTASGLITQLRFDADITPAATVELLQVRNNAGSPATVCTLNYNAARTLQFTGSGTLNASSLTPAVAVNDELLIDLVTALHTSPTTSNGRIFYRVKNLTNLSWATSGEFFYDTGYTVNLGVATLNHVRFGKVSTAAALPSPGLNWQFLGWQQATVLTSDTSTAQAKAYFADAPATVVQLGTPATTYVTKVDPTTVGGTDGSVTVSWAAVPNAAAYRVEWAPGYDAASGFTVASSSATSPYTVTGLSDGDYTVSVRALA